MLGAAQYDGRPSPQLAARLDHALDLWNDGIAPVVVVTGGNQPGDRFTEAEASANYLVDHGVPETAIMREDQGSTTYESLDAAAQQLSAAGLDEVVLVTDPYHSLRSRLIAEEVGLDASLSPTPTSVVTGWGSFRRESAGGRGSRGRADHRLRSPERHHGLMSRVHRGSWRYTRRSLRWGVV